MGEELTLRCEIMALWAGKGKTLARVKCLQLKCFQAFKQYREWKKHSKRVLEQKIRKFKKEQRRKVFQGW